MPDEKFSWLAKEGWISGHKQADGDHGVQKCFLWQQKQLADPDHTDAVAPCKYTVLIHHNPDAFDVATHQEKH